MVEEVQKKIPKAGEKIAHHHQPQLLLSQKNGKKKNQRQLGVGRKRKKEDSINNIVLSKSNHIIENLGQKQKICLKLQGKILEKEKENSSISTKLRVQHGNQILYQQENVVYQHRRYVLVCIVSSQTIYMCLSSSILGGT